MDTVLQMLKEYANTKGNNYKKIFLEDIAGESIYIDSSNYWD